MRYGATCVRGRGSFSEDPAVALPILLDYVAAGRLELSSRIGPVFPLEEIEAAVQASLAGPPGRVLVEP